MAYEENTKGKLLMNTSAIIMLVVVGIIVWGGFILTMIVALKREKSKK